MCCSPWGHKESDTTEQLNWTELKMPEGASLVVQWLRLCTPTVGFWGTGFDAWRGN